MGSSRGRGPCGGTWSPLGRKYPLTAGLLEDHVRLRGEGHCSGTGDLLRFQPQCRGAVLRQGYGFGRQAGPRQADRHRKGPGPFPPSPSVAAFCVHTPSAVVTDKGDQAAEFGVEVDRSKATFTHVFRGSIAVGAKGFQGVYPARAGTCVWTRAGGRHDSLLIFKPGPEAAIFVTKMPKPQPVCLTQPAANENHGANSRRGG